MIFEEEIIDNKIIPQREYRMLSKKAARAVIINNDKILLIKVEDRGYKLPGGGLEDGETYIKALLREIKEETGYSECIIKQNIGKVIQRNVDRFDSMVIFEMESKYYLCEVFGAQGETSLTTKEKLDRMEPVWVDIDEAISKNEEYIKESTDKMWVTRENVIFRHIKEAYFNY